MYQACARTGTRPLARNRQREGQDVGIGCPASRVVRLSRSTRNGNARTSFAPILLEASHFSNEDDACGHLLKRMFRFSSGFGLTAPNAIRERRTEGSHSREAPGHNRWFAFPRAMSSMQGVPNGSFGRHALRSSSCRAGAPQTLILVSPTTPGASARCRLQEHVGIDDRPGLRIPCQDVPNVDRSAPNSLGQNAPSVAAAKFAPITGVSQLA